MTSTGSVQSASKTIFRHEEHGMVFLTLTNGSGVTLVAGQEVKIKASVDLTVDVRTLGTDIPAGIITVGDADGKDMTIATPFDRTVKAIAKGGTINAGDQVIPNGTFNAAGLPEYVKTVTAGHFVTGICLKGSVVDGQIVIGHLRAPYKI